MTEVMMGNTYDSAAEADADRDQQKTLGVALGAWDRALRRDECGAWCIHGIKQYRRDVFHNSIHAWGDGKTWALYVQCRSTLHWSWTKKKLSFCAVTQDGDDEGVLRLDHLPTPGQANVIREVLGIKKHRELSAEVLARLKTFAFVRSPRSGATVQPYTGSGDLPASEAHPASNDDFGRHTCQLTPVPDVALGD